MSSDQTSMNASRNLVDFSALSTEPGAVGPFAPPPGGKGEDSVYRKRIREALIQKRERYQQLLALIRWEDSTFTFKRVGFVGPYADSAQSVYDDLKAELSNAAA